MIKKLDISYHNKLIKYLKKEPEFNLFIIGDIERYGYDKYFFNIWGDLNTNGDIEGVLVKYFDFITVYSECYFNTERFVRLINTLDYCEISGKSEIIDSLSSKIKLRKIRVVNFCRLNQNKANLDNRYHPRMKKIRFGNIKKIVRLYESIDEFENTTLDSIKTGLKTGRGYCIEVNNKVIAMAKSTAENKTHAMLVGVGTHPNYRNKGYATKCIEKICYELLKEEKVPCLFYDNKEAGKVYEKIGFEKIGYWSIAYR